MTGSVFIEYFFDLRKEEDAPIFTGMQAKYSDDTAQMLETVKEDILVQLKRFYKDTANTVF